MGVLFSEANPSGKLSMLSMNGATMVEALSKYVEMMKPNEPNDNVC